MVDRIAFSDFPDLSVEDVVSLERSPTDPTLLEVSLTSVDPVTWWKAVELRGPDGRLITNVETQDANRGPNTMSLPASALRGARLVLAKAKLFGIHTGMYEVRNIDAQAGRRLRFVWQRDVDTAGPVAGFFRDIGRGVDTAANAVADAVATVFHAIGDAIADIVEAIGNFVAGIFEAIGRVFEGIPGIGPVIRGFFHWLSTTVSAAFDLIAMVIKAIFSVIGDILGGIVRIIGGALGGLLAWDAGLAGRSVGRGLVDIGDGIAGAVVLIFLKAVASIQSVIFMQLGDRMLTRDELALLQRVFRRSLAYSNIRVVEGFAGFFSINPNRAMTFGNRIYRKNTPDAAWPDVLVHEACHVWQSQHRGTRYLMDALVAQAGSGYAWKAAVDGGVQVWEDLNVESQAQFIQDAWRFGTQNAPRVTGGGVFFKDDPIGADVEFRFDGGSFTWFAIEATAYIRSHVSFRVSQ